MLPKELHLVALHWPSNRKMERPWGKGRDKTGPNTELCFTVSNVPQHPSLAVIPESIMPRHHKGVYGKNERKFLCFLTSAGKAGVTLTKVWT